MIEKTEKNISMLLLSINVFLQLFCVFTNHPGTAQLIVSCQDKLAGSIPDDQQTTYQPRIDVETTGQILNTESSQYWESPEYTTYANESGSSSPAEEDKHKWHGKL